VERITTHVKDKVEVVVGLNFREPYQFKETLKLYAYKIILTSSTYTTRRSGYLHFVRKFVIGEYMHSELLIRCISRSSP
jgi:hypothetical protein